MKRITPRHIVVAAVVSVAGIGVAAGSVVAAGASSAAEQDTPITGSALELASRAALAHTGSGRVTQTEVGDEDSYYEVEVTLRDGSEVDVQLDRDFRVVGSDVESTAEAND